MEGSSMALPENPVTLPPFQAQPFSRRRPWLAIILGLLFGPLAQVYCGRLRRAFFFIGLDVIATVVVLAILSYFPWGKLAVLLGMVLMAAFWLSMPTDAWFLARKSSAQTLAPYQRWWFYILFGLSFFAFQQGEGRFLSAYWMEAFVMSTGSMKEAVIPGDCVLVDKTWYRFHPFRHGDILAYFNRQQRPEAYLHRLIALPGDRVEVRGEEVYLNNQRLAESYAQYQGPKVPRYVLNWEQLEKFGPQTVPEGYLFILGDMRRRAVDSRIWGCIPIKDVIGRAQVIYWSFGPRDTRSTISPLPEYEQDQPYDAESEDPDSIRWERIGRRLN
jgi:signal peptidase I